MRSAFLFFWLAIAPASLAGAAARADEPMPQGVQVRMTPEGPAFATREGMTLYTSTRDEEKGKSRCTDNREAQSLQSDTAFYYPTPGGDQRRSCIQKTPPLLAQADSKPVGEWSIIDRADGLRQWAYRGAALYTSTADKRPGDANGPSPLQAGTLQFGWLNVAAPPLEGPPNIAAAKAPEGIILVDAKGSPLYSPSAKAGASKEACGAGCPWSPYLAPQMAADHKHRDWSVSVREDGTRQWAYRGKPVFTNAKSRSAPEEPGEHREGWEPIVLWQQPRTPAEIKVGYALVGPVYTDARGKTLYTFHCVEETKDALPCDQQGDTSRYYLSMCGGPEKCAQTWRPLIAPPNAKPSSSLWSVVSIDPGDPIRVPDSSKAVNVWAYKGQPLFTFAGDEAPGAANGEGMRVWRSSAWAVAVPYGYPPYGMRAAAAR
ncbi:MAG: hypothetical protein ABW110_19760 [Steroidobacteraceae bacterium]